MQTFGCSERQKRLASEQFEEERNHRLQTRIALILD